MKKRVSAALAQLQAVNELAIREAGPRYTPGLDPDAPNIEIGYLVDAFDALSLVDGWRARAQELGERITKATEYQTHLLDGLFRRRRATPARLVEQVQALGGLREPAALRRAAVQLRSNCEHVVRRLEREAEALWEQLRELPDEPPSGDQRSRLQSDAPETPALAQPAREVHRLSFRKPARAVTGAQRRRPRSTTRYSSAPWWKWNGSQFPGPSS
jgi:hypothetical protein